MTESDWRTDVPDWRDGERRAEIQTGDGSIIAGKLSIKDMFFDGEEEAPIFAMTSDSGEVLDFYGADRWRFVDA